MLVCLDSLVQFFFSIFVSFYNKCEKRNGKVNILLLRENSMNTISKLHSLLVIRQFTLHPNGIRIRRIRKRSVDGTFTTTSNSIVTLSRPWRIPIERDIHTGHTSGDCSRFGITLSLYSGQEFGDDFSLVAEDAAVDDVDDGFVEEFETGLGCPGVFDGLEFWTAFAGLLAGDHEVVERGETGVGAAEDVGVVAGVDGRGDEGGCFGVCSGDGEEVGSFI